MTTPPSADPSLEDRVYAALKEVARRYLGGRPGASLQPTDLLHEAWLRLSETDSERDALTDEQRFRALAARVMRFVLVDHVRARRAKKRGGDLERVTLSGLPSDDGGGIDLLHLDGALTRLSELEPRVATLVELTYFGGLTGGQAAAAVGVSRDTVVRDLKLGRAWLARELERLRDDDPRPA